MIIINDDPWQSAPGALVRGIPFAKRGRDESGALIFESRNETLKLCKDGSVLSFNRETQAWIPANWLSASDFQPSWGTIFVSE
jgi:hypothetical protein